MKNRRQAFRGCVLRAGLVLAGLIAWSAPAAAAIHYNLESPSTSFPASGVGNVAGWAYTDTPGAKINKLITVQIDNEPSFRVPCCSGRGDVQAVHPSAPINTGFSGAHNFQRLSPGTHTIKLTIKSSAYETKVVTKQFEVVKVSPYKFLDSFKWKSGAECESVNGMDPAHGNAGAVCNKTRAVSKGPGNPSADCNGTLQFAFNRAAQTFHPVAGCDPQGTVDNGNGGGGVIELDPGKFFPGFGKGPTIDIGKIPPGLFGCLVGTPSNISVNVKGIAPTFTFTTAVAAKVAVEVFKQGEMGGTLQAFGYSDKNTFHSFTPHPLLSTIKPDTVYEYRIRVKSNCGKADVLVNGPSTFKTPKRVVRMYIDKGKVIDDGDDWPAGSGEIEFALELNGNTAYTGEYSLDDGDWVYPSIVATWVGAPDYFTAKFWGMEFDGNFESAEVKTLDFTPNLTYPGGTWTGTRHVTDDNMNVKLWLRVEVTYE